MRTIAHISDLHFGRVNPKTLPALRDSIAAARPDVVVVSGDLTQRARSREFQAARHFLDMLPSPQIVVPGNHDVPLYNLFARWLSPLGKYRRYITDNLMPLFADQEVAVLGLNTARSLTIKDGRLNIGQMDEACRIMSAHRAAGIRVLVTHHPFDDPEPGRSRDIVGRADLAMQRFSRCGIDLILTGHLHQSHAGNGGGRYETANTTLFVHAGTATSTRQRDEKNAWNLLRIDGDALSVSIMGWNEDEATFQTVRVDRFQRGRSGWTSNILV